MIPTITTTECEVQSKNEDGNSNKSTHHISDDDEGYGDSDDDTSNWCSESTWNTSDSVLSSPLIHSSNSATLKRNTILEMVLDFSLLTSPSPSSLPSPSVSTSDPEQEQQKRQLQEEVTPKVRTVLCSEECCEELPKCKGLCNYHYRLSLRNTKSNLGCIAQGCALKQRRRGLCYRHYIIFTELRKRKAREEGEGSNVQDASDDLECQYEPNESSGNGHSKKSKKEGDAITRRNGADKEIVSLGINIKEEAKVILKCSFKDCVSVDIYNKKATLCRKHYRETKRNEKRKGNIK